MADTIDDFGRTIKISFNDLRDALVNDLKQQERNTENRSDNTKEIKKLNDNLEKIIGRQLVDELKALQKLVKNVSECCEKTSKERGKSKSKSDRKEDAKIFAEAIADKLGSGKGRDAAREIGDLLRKDVLPAFDTVNDKTLNFGQVLERSQRRFSTAFKMVGKQFQSDFGAITGAIRDKLGKINPLKLGMDAATESSEWFKNAWQGLINTASKSWTTFTEAASSRWSKISNGLSERLTLFTDDVKYAFSYITDNVIVRTFTKAGEKISKVWQDYGKPFLETLSKPFKAVGNKFMQYINPISKAIGGTVKDFFRMGSSRTAHKEVDDMLAKPDIVAMHGHDEHKGEGKNGKSKGTESGLCRCICKCISRLMGVSKDIAKSSKDTATTTRATGKVSGRTGDATVKALKAATDSSNKKSDKEESQQALMREWMKQESKKRWEERGARAKSKMLSGAAYAQNLIFGGKPIETLLHGASMALAKTTGKILEAPFDLAGKIVSLIPFIGGLGPIIGAFGAALGGLAEGLVHLVLTPLIKQVEFIGDATKSMFVSTGATSAPPTISAGKAPGGEEWSDLAKTMMEVDRNMESISKTLDVLGTKMSDVVETGHDFETIQKSMLKNFRKGIRDNKDLNKVTKTGLQTAYLLDSNAEHTADMFADWHQTLGMSSVDLRSMQRGMTQIARSTGLVGDNLMDAAKSASEFMDNMRKAGTLTAESSRSLIEMMARAKLTGTEGAAKSFAKILSQGRLRGNLSGHEQTLAAIGGGGNSKLIDAITFGTVQGNKELEKEFANNLEGWLKAQVGGDPTKSLDQNMKKMSAEQISRLSYLTQQLFGMGAKEFQLQIKNMQKGAQSFSENIAEIEKAGSAEAMSLDKLRAVADKEIGWRAKFDTALNNAKGDTSKALDELLNMADLPKEMRKQFEGQLNAQQVAYQRQQLFITTGADLMDKFNNIMEDGGKNVDGALEELARGSKDFREYLGKIGTDAGKGGMAIEKVLEDQAKRLMEEANKFGMGEDISKLLPDPADIKKALKDNDKAALKIIADRFARAKGMVETGGMKNTSPMELIKQYLNQIAGMFNELMQAGLKEVLPMLMHAIKDFSRAPFWKAFKEGDLKKGFELFGEYIKGIVPNIQKAMAEIGSLAESEGFRKFLTTLISGIGTAVKPLFDAVGAAFTEENPKIMKFIENVKKFINETDWNKVAEGLAAISVGIVKFVEMIGKIVEFLGPTGTLIAGLAILAGPTGISALTLAFNPLGAIMATLVIGAGLLYEAWTRVNDAQKEAAKLTGQQAGIDENRKNAALAAGGAAAAKGDAATVRKLLTAKEKEQTELETRIRELEAKGTIAQGAPGSIADESGFGSTFYDAFGDKVAREKKRNEERELAEKRITLGKVQEAKNALMPKVKEAEDTAAAMLAKVAADRAKDPAMWANVDKMIMESGVSRDYRMPGKREYKDTTGTAIMADNQGDADRIFKGMGKTIESFADVRKRLNHKGILDWTPTGETKVGPEDIKKYVGSVFAKLTQDQVETNNLTKELIVLNKTEPEKAMKIAEAMRQKLIENLNFNEMSYDDWDRAIENIATVEKAQAVMAELAKKGVKPGSIYTHDIYLEDLMTEMVANVSDMNYILSNIYDSKIAEAMEAGNVTARVPVDAEQELRKREAELRVNAGTDMSETEANTGATAANTRATVRAINMVGKLLAKVLANGGSGLSGLSGPDYSIDTFFDEALSTTWHSANPDRQPGLDVDGH